MKAPALQAVSTPRAPRALGPYSQAVVLDGWVYASGQIALDPETGELVSGGAGEQAERCLENLKALLEAAGSGLERVLKVSVYLVDLGDFEAVNEVYGRFFKPPYPARATVQVAALPKRAAVEIDAVGRI